MRVHTWLTLALAGGLFSAPGAGQTFVGFGDSITFGINSSWGDGYMGIYGYYNSWELPGTVFVNQGLSGEYTSDGISRIGSAMGNASHVFIMEGTNDISAGVSGNSVAANLRVMAAIVAGAGKTPVIGSTPPRKSWDIRDPGNGAAMAVAYSMSSYAAGNGHPYGPVFEYMFAHPDTDSLIADRVHPKDNGFQIMTWAWHDGLRPTYGDPTLASIAQDWGVINQPHTVAVTGTGLGAGMEGWLFNMLDYTQKVYATTGVSVTAPTDATVSIPATIPRGVYDLVLSFPSGGGAVLHAGWSASWSPPTLSSITPDRVPENQTQTLTIDGSDLQPGAVVEFDGSPGTNLVWNSYDQITIDNPPLPAGGYDVRIENPDRSEATFPDAFFALGVPPTLTSVSPSVGDNTADVPIVLTGTEFVTGAEVLLDATPLASVTVTSATRIDATVPIGHPEGIYDVTVRNPDSQTATLPGGYESQDPPPIVTSVLPNVIEAGSRTLLTVSGDFFNAGVRAFAGTTELVDVLVSSPQVLSAYTPRGLPPGVHDVRVESASGKSGTLTAGLTSDDGLSPRLVLAHPADGTIGPDLPALDLWLHDQGAGVDSGSIAIEIDGVPQASVTTAGGPRLVQVSLVPTAPLALGSVVTVRIQADDLDSTVSSLDQDLTFTVTDGVDGSDGDTLPSDWELAQGLDPTVDDSGEDPDRDGRDNLREYSDGTDPTTPAFLAAAPGPGPANRREATWFLGGGQPWDTQLSPLPGAYGLNLGTADLEALGYAQLLTGPGPSPNYGPQVQAWDEAFTALARVNFYAYGTLRYGVKPAGAALLGDLQEVILTGPGPGAVFGPQVRAFQLNGTLQTLSKVNFYAYQTLKYGVTPLDGFVDGDGYAEILTAAPPGPVFGPHVRGFDYDANRIAAISSLNFFPYPTQQWGLDAATGDLDADGFDEILTGQGPGSTFPAQVRGFDYDGSAVQGITGLDFIALNGQYGVKVASGDLDGDIVDEIAAGQGEDPSLGARVRTFDWTGSAITLSDFFAWEGMAYGVNLTTGRPGLVP